jgi:DNA-3-methyladenine glycosylase
MAARRGLTDPKLLCAGPGRLTQALGVTAEHDGSALDLPPFVLLPRAHEPDIVVAPRVGISSATDLPWRYSVAGSAFVSRPRPRA